MGTCELPSINASEVDYKLAFYFKNQTCNDVKMLYHLKNNDNICERLNLQDFTFTPIWITVVLIKRTRTASKGNLYLQKKGSHN